MLSKFTNHINMAQVQKHLNGFERWVFPPPPKKIAVQWQEI